MSSFSKLIIMSEHIHERRNFLKKSSLAFLGISSVSLVRGSENHFLNKSIASSDSFFYRYPSMDDEMVSSVVGASHNNFDKVKELITNRPELAKAAWDWGFGDWETALGAASHVGRRDIAELLMSYGARPDIFTYTMLGMLKSVQEIIETIPGIQKQPGPHGITLLQHAKNRLSNKDISTGDAANVNKVVTYLESVGDADLKQKNLEATDTEKQNYLGEYRFGEGESEIFVVLVNSRNLLQLSRKGGSARNLFKTGENTFSPAGAASVSIIFNMKDNKAVSLSIHEPDPRVIAKRI